MTLTRHQIDEHLRLRKIARRDQEFECADAHRDLLAAHGITVTDTPDGQIASHGTEAELRAAQSALTAANSRIAELEKREAAKRGQMLGASVHMQRTVTKLCEVKALLHEARPYVDEACCLGCVEREILDRIDAALTPDIGSDPIMDEVERMRAAALAAPSINALKFDAKPACWCRKCRSGPDLMPLFIVCPDCGNKRCPKASDHTFACTNSNEPGQPGSIYTVPTKEPT